MKHKTKNNKKGILEMNRKQKQNEQKPKGENKKCCMECGSSRGTLHKIKMPNGRKGYLCGFCFDAYRNEQ